MEEWKDIEGYEGIYQVSNLGRVKRLETYVKCELKYSEEKKIKEHILKCGTRRSGYLNVTLCKKGKTHSYDVHRLVAKAFCEKDDETFTEVNHINCNKKDNRASNLEWVSSERNREHAKENSRYVNPMRRDIYSPTLHKNFLGSYEAAEYINNLKFGNSKKIKHIAQKIREVCNGINKSAYGEKWIYTSSLKKRFND